MMKRERETINKQHISSSHLVSHITAGVVLVRTALRCIVAVKFYIHWSLVIIIKVIFLTVYILLIFFFRKLYVLNL